MPSRLRSIFLSLTVASTLAYAAGVQSAERGSKPSPSYTRIALWGDEFYSDDPVVKQEMIAQTVGSMNAHQLDLTLFVGDSKNGSSPCTDQAIGEDVAKIFDSINAPTLYSLGDNEWTDCHRTSDGSFDPLGRLAYLRKVFFGKSTTQGPNPLPVERQGTLGEAYSENSRLVLNGVMFVALHIPGSNNNLVATQKQCSKGSNRTQADCAAASAEYRARNVKNLEWLKESFALARAARYAGVVVAIQADVYFPFKLSDGSYQEQFLPRLNADNGYSDFFKTLVAETHHFSGQVLLVHGDSHQFKLDKAMYEENGQSTPNFTRVEVFGSHDNSWVLMGVDPSSDGVFKIEPVILKR